VSGFDAINEEIRNGSGGYLKLNTAGQIVTGVVLDVVVREKVFKGNKVLNSKTGEVRKEWVFTLDIEGEPKKWAAGEVAQYAIRQALNGVKIEKGGKLRIEVTKSSVQGESQAELNVEYIPPQFQSLPNTEDTPF
jgi:hypothetical protein